MRSPMMPAWMRSWIDDELALIRDGLRWRSRGASGLGRSLWCDVTSGEIRSCARTAEVTGARILPGLMRSSVRTGLGGLTLRQMAQSPQTRSGRTAGRRRCAKPRLSKRSGADQRLLEITARTWFARLHSPRDAEVGVAVLRSGKYAARRHAVDGPGYHDG